MDGKRSNILYLPVPSTYVPQTEMERQLLAENVWLRERVASLEKRVEELSLLLAKALKNSSTSSKPPSSDIVKPPKPPSGSAGGKRKKGGQPGHPRHERKAFSPEEVAEFKRYVQDTCPHCGGAGELSAEHGERVVQQVELVPERTRVEEHCAPAHVCTCCGKVYYAPLPAAVEKGGLIGPVLTAQIAYMKGALHASYTTIRKYVRDTMGLTVSRGQLSKIVQKVSDALEGPYSALMELLSSQEILNIDETGHKNNGDRFWTWCFRAQDFTVFKVSPTRATSVIYDVLGKEFSGVIGCDYFSSYRKYMRECDVRVQFCLAHFIREVRFLIQLPDAATAKYGKRLLKKFRELFHVIHLHETLPPVYFRLRLERARDEILAEAQKRVPEAREAQLIAKRLRERGEAYFQFITTPGIEPTNNLAEQAIRFITIDRHITQGTRSEGGQRWCERIWTVMATCAAQGRSAFDYLVEVVHAYFNGMPISGLLPDTS